MPIGISFKWLFLFFVRFFTLVCLEFELVGGGEVEDGGGELKRLGPLSTGGSVLLRKSTSPTSSRAGRPVSTSASSSSDSIAYGSFTLLCFLPGGPELESVGVGTVFGGGGGCGTDLGTVALMPGLVFGSRPEYEFTDSAMPWDIWLLDLFAGERVPIPILSVARLFVVSKDLDLLICAPGGPSFRKLIRSSLAWRSMTGVLIRAFFAAARLVLGTTLFTEGCIGAERDALEPGLVGDGLVGETRRGA